jgi:hypothetical protein
MGEDGCGGHLGLSLALACMGDQKYAFKKIVPEQYQLKYATLPTNS